ncbi:CpaD family pilus assembly lipoprotein [Trinickia sp. Y13]|uniref:CpaD family pilus assembly lipoprotein n=1 Tax=Trinickia sp. Y13 TaxID=2917807 RepID=UPI00240562F3|nr:CpaD family pilus assembly lipoprotein [Trinickia sp. Y13]MDG0023286.1 CpaD family pilus assembly protein [Trinickia sp. Y13]
MRHRFSTLIVSSIMVLAAGSGLTGCMSEHPPLGMPNDSVIGFSSENGGQAVAPSCDQLNQPSHMLDAGRARPGVAFGCATYSNLAAMLVRPADLVAPLPYAGADAALAASAVRAYEEGRAQPLRSTSTTTSVAH